MMLKQLYIERQIHKMNFSLNLIPYTKMNSKWITDLNMKAKTFGRKQRRKCLRSKARQKVPKLDMVRFDNPLKAQSIKGNTDNLDFIKFRNFGFVKHYTKWMKPQATEWKKITVTKPYICTEDNY